MSNYSILSILTVLLFGLLPFSVKADTADVDTHFDVRVVETADSKKGAEAVAVSVKNITNQTGKNVKATVELPKAFADKLKTEAVTRALGTLEAGESKSFTIKLSDGSTTTLSTTGSSKNLPTTGETIFKRAIIVGVMLLIIAGFILRKRKLLGLLVALLALTGAALVSASTYHHKAIHHHQVKVVGQTLPFTTVVTGDFEAEANTSSDSDNPETPEEPVMPEVIKYTVTFVNGLNSDAIEVEADSTVSEPSNPTKTGYRFDGWYEAGAEQPFDFSTPITKDMTLTAKWTANSYNITYHLDGGDNFADAPTSYTIETPTITLGIPTKAGFTFDGWYTNSEKTELGTTIAQGSTGDKTFYAKWTANTYSLTVNKDGSSWSDHGKTFTLKLASNEGTSYTATDTTFSAVPEGTYNLYDSETNKIESNLSVINSGSTTLNYYTVSFNTDGGSTAPESQVIYSGQNATSPSSNPTKAGTTFAGWVTEQSGNTAFTFSNITAKQTAYAKWIEEKYSVSFDLNGGSAEGLENINNISYGATIEAPTITPTKNIDEILIDISDDFIFAGWYQEAATTPYDFDSPITSNLTLYAKWTLPIVEVEGHGDDTLGTQWDNVWISNSWWRILKATADDKALVIKENALTESEATGTGLETGYYNAQFRDGSTYFGSDSVNGYEAGAADDPSQASTKNGITYLKGAIDYYYNNSISSTYSDYVLPVNLNNPSYATYVGTGFLGTAASYDYWFWDSRENYYQNQRFPTLLTADNTMQQAFALSLGDIHAIDGVETNDTYCGLLNFLSNSPNYFWLRSAGSNFNLAGDVDYGIFYYGNIVYTGLPVRPALWVSLD